MPARCPAASILVATYNSGPYLAATLESALSQTFPDFELIVVDDGSTDDTPGRLLRYTDPRMRVLCQANQGQPAALNAALKVARGAFVGFLDHDDLWLPAKLARHMAYFERHPEVDLTFSWSRLIDADGNDLGLHPRFWRGAISFGELLEDFVIGNTSSVVMRREALDRVGGFDPALERCFDLDSFARVALLRPNNVHAIEEVLTLYRRHPGQLSRDWRAMERSWEATLAKLRQAAPRETAAVERRASSNHYRYLAYLAYEGRQFREAARLLSRGLRSSPAGFLTDRRNWKLAAACGAGAVLPSGVLAALERFAGGAPSRRR
jgi:glycosyltransferase involved in cell wall biosynthesis